MSVVILLLIIIDNYLWYLVGRRVERKRFFKMMNTAISAIFTSAVEIPKTSKPTKTSKPKVKNLNKK